MSKKSIFVLIVVIFVGGALSQAIWQSLPAGIVAVMGIIPVLIMAVIVWKVFTSRSVNDYIARSLKELVDYLRR